MVKNSTSEHYKNTSKSVENRWRERCFTQRWSTTRLQSWKSSRRRRRSQRKAFPNGRWTAISLETPSCSKKQFKMECLLPHRYQKSINVFNVLVAVENSILNQPPSIFLCAPKRIQWKDDRNDDFSAMIWYIKIVFHYYLDWFKYFANIL